MQEIIILTQSEIDKLSDQEYAQYVNSNNIKVVR